MTRNKKLEISNDEILIPELEEAMETYIPRGHWSENDEKILKKYFGRVPIRTLEGYLHKSRHAVNSKATIMGLTNRETP